MPANKKVAMSKLKEEQATILRDKVSKLAVQGAWD